MPLIVSCWEKQRGITWKIWCRIESDTKENHQSSWWGIRTWCHFPQIPNQYKNPFANFLNILVLKLIHFCGYNYSHPNTKLFQWVQSFYGPNCIWATCFSSVLWKLDCMVNRWKGRSGQFGPNPFDHQLWPRFNRNVNNDKKIYIFWDWLWWVQLVRPPVFSDVTSFFVGVFMGYGLINESGLD